MIYRVFFVCFLAMVVLFSIACPPDDDDDSTPPIDDDAIDDDTMDDDAVDDDQVDDDITDDDIADDDVIDDDIVDDDIADDDVVDDDVVDDDVVDDDVVDDDAVDDDLVDDDVIDDDAMDDDTTDDDTIAVDIEEIDWQGPTWSDYVDGAVSLYVDGNDDLHIGYRRNMGKSVLTEFCEYTNFWYATNESGEWERRLVEEGDCDYWLDPWGHGSTTEWEEVGDVSAVAVSPGGLPCFAYHRKYLSHYYYGYLIPPDWYSASGMLKYAVGEQTGTTLDYDSTTFNSYWLAARETGAAVSLVFDAGGTAHISYNKAVAGSSSGQNMLAYTTVSGGGEQEILILDEYTNQSRGTSVGLDEAGHIFIAYQAGGALNLASNESGSWETNLIYEPASPYNVHGVSMVVEPNGDLHIVYVVIDYYDVDTLKYAHREDGIWNIISLDDGEVMGMLVSMVQDTEGFLHISYQKALKSQLRYATNKNGEWQNFAVAEQWSMNDPHGHAIGIDSQFTVHIAFENNFSLWHAAIPAGPLKQRIE